MSYKLYDEEAIRDIADAIREKSGSAETFTVGDMAQAVEDIPSSIIETDPTVPSWAKQATKPTYTAQEVGALPTDVQLITDWETTQSGTITGIEMIDFSDNADTVFSVSVEKESGESTEYLIPDEVRVATIARMCLAINHEYQGEVLPYAITAIDYTDDYNSQEGLIVSAENLDDVDNRIQLFIPASIIS